MESGKQMSLFVSSAEAQKRSSFCSQRECYHTLPGDAQAVATGSEGGGGGPV